MKIYVAAKWEERPRAQEVMAQLVRAGHTITYNWTLNENFTQACAVLDANGVKDADVVLALVEKDLPYQGLWVEVGIAVGRGIPVMLVGDYGEKNIFTLLPLVQRVKSVDEFLQGAAC